MPTAPDSRTVTSLRREVALACDADGYVTWTDQAAVALLGASIGARVTTYAALGSEQELETLLRLGREDRVEGVETKGTGLGLSQSRRLAELPGGTLTLSSVAGAGSTFTLTVSCFHPEIEEMASLTRRSARLEPRKPPILVVEEPAATNA